MNPDTFNMLWKITVIVVMIIGLFIIVKYIAGGDVVCIKNPFIYGANKFSEQYDAPVYCSCSIGTIPMKQFDFNEKEWNPSQKNNQYSYIPIPALNFTDL